MNRRELIAGIASIPVVAKAGECKHESHRLIGAKDQSRLYECNDCQYRWATPDSTREYWRYWEHKYGRHTKA